MCPSVLIVDDSDFTRKSLSDILKKQKYKIVGEAIGGLEALEKYKKLKPDVVILDIILEGMDGIEALAAIKEYDTNAKVVMISGIKYKAMKRNAVDKGAIGFITKPYQKSDVIKVLNGIFRDEIGEIDG